VFTHDDAKIAPRILIQSLYSLLKQVLFVFERRIADCPERPLEIKYFRADVTQLTRASPPVK